MAGQLDWGFQGKAPVNQNVFQGCHHWLRMVGLLDFRMKITQGFDGLVDNLDGHPRKQLVHIFLGICPAIKKGNLTCSNKKKRNIMWIILKTKRYENCVVNFPYHLSWLYWYYTVHYNYDNFIHKLKQWWKLFPVMCN